MTTESLGTCAQCPEPAVTRWTLNDRRDVGMVDLCAKHSQPLERLLFLGQVQREEVLKAPAEDIEPAPDRPRRNYRKPHNVPFEWTPPAKV